MITEQRTSQGFTHTLADYEDATREGRYALAGQAADRLPLSEWSENRRGIMTPCTVALNWRSNVSDTAHDLLVAVTASENGGTAGSKKKLRKAARALLRALGED